MGLQLNHEYPKPMCVDESAPDELEMQLVNPKTKEVVFTKNVAQKHFSTGSVGYFVSGKMINPISKERYQVSCNIALIGSKPKSKEGE